MGLASRLAAMGAAVTAVGAGGDAPGPLRRAPGADDPVVFGWRPPFPVAADAYGHRSCVPCGVEWRGEPACWHCGRHATY